MRKARTKRTGTVAIFAGIVLTVLAEGPGAFAVQHNNLSFPGTLGRIRVRPVFQDGTGATLLQTGVPTDPATNPNRTVGDDVVPLTFNTAGGPRFTGVNPSAGDTHTHYHAGDAQILVNDRAGFRVGDTIMVGSAYCNFPFLGKLCKSGSINEQPLGQVVHIVDGVGPTIVGPGNIVVSPLVDNPQCVSFGFGPCAFLDGTQIIKQPTLYQGQQFRVDIPHNDLLDCDIITNVCHPNDVAVTANFTPPQGSHDPGFPTRPLTLNRDTTATSAIVAAGCGPGVCGAGFFSFYIPKEITGTGTIGTRFSVDVPDTWYEVEVTARDVGTGVIVADGVVRFKLNPVAILQFSPHRNPIGPGDAVDLRGRLRDNTSAVALNTRPAEDIIVDVSVTSPSGVQFFYATTSCVDTDPSPNDRCGSDPFAAPGQNGHGTFQIRHGGLQGLFVGFPNIFQSTLNCQGQVMILNPSTYPNLLNIPGCLFGTLLSPLGSLEPGTYDASASLRGYIPPVQAFTTFDVRL